MRQLVAEALGLLELAHPGADVLQRAGRKLMKAGDSAERAVLKLAKMYRLSLADCELLHLALNPMGETEMHAIHTGLSKKDCHEKGMAMRRAGKTCFCLPNKDDPKKRDLMAP